MYHGAAVIKGKTPFLYGWGVVPNLLQIEEIRHKTFSPSFLFASLVWSSVGAGYFIYGRKQKSWIATAGGLALIITSYLVSSALLMSLLSISIMTAVYLLHKRGL